MQIPSSTPHCDDLEIAAVDLVRRLGGRWSPGGTMCRCPAHDDRSPSLSIRIGRHSLLFKCFAGCDTRDVLGAIRALGGDIPQFAIEHERPASNSPQDHIALVRRLWAHACPLSGTAAEAYLASRGLSGRSDALRFHSAVQLGPRKVAAYRPALLALVKAGIDIVAVQRIFLDPAGGGLARDLDQPRRLLGRPVSGCVQLSPASDSLGLAEGIETALSATVLLGIPVWATLGNERLARVTVPPTVTRLLLLPDNDRAGRLAEKLARATHAAPGRIIETLWPWRGLNDWNDVLRSEGKGGGDRMRTSGLILGSLPQAET